MKSLAFNIGGVPEHFNLLFCKAIDEGVFCAKNLDLNWKYYNGGTGDLVEALVEKQIDIGVLLTEGDAKAIADQNSFKIVQVYVNSPLHWGVYCGAGSILQSLNDVKQPSFYISRFGSGSHLMSYRFCQRERWSMDQVEFIEVANFSRAINEFNQNPDKLFLWERFMTKPYVDRGTLKKIGEVPTPWASFSIVVHEDILNNHENAVILFLKLISDYTYKLKQNTLDSIDYISTYLEFSVIDMKQCIQDTDWNYLPDVPYPKLKIALDFLKEVKLVEVNFDINHLCPGGNFWTKCSL